MTLRCNSCRSKVASAHRPPYTATLLGESSWKKREKGQPLKNRDKEPKIAWLLSPGLQGKEEVAFPEKIKEKKIADLSRFSLEKVTDGLVRAISTTLNPTVLPAHISSTSSPQGSHSDQMRPTGSTLLPACTSGQLVQPSLRMRLSYSFVQMNWKKEKARGHIET